jgi:hypothetical protein
MELLSIGWLVALSLSTYGVYRLCVALQGASR